MKKATILLILLNLTVFQSIIAIDYFTNQETAVPLEVKTPVKEQPIVVQPELPPIKNNITNATPSYMSYDQTIEQLKKWNKESPEMTEVGVYGKSSLGKDLYYIRIANKRPSDVDRPCVMITACIHGNEPLASSTTMWYIGSLLKQYNDDESIRSLLDSRDIYFVPVVSPDSYPRSRYVDGVDPNRNFPGSSTTKKPVAPVVAIMDLFNRIKPKAVISGHTWGRVYLIPPGDRMQDTPHHKEFVRVVGKMSELSGYQLVRACDLYLGNGRLNPKMQNGPRSLGEMSDEYTVNIPIYGTEVDWYYKNGAFPIVIEFGTHQRIPKDSETKSEFDKTYKAVLHFIEEAPLVDLLL